MTAIDLDWSGPIHGDLIVNEETRDVSLNGELVTLTRVEFDLLATLYRTPRRVYTRRNSFRRPGLPIGLVTSEAPRCTSHVFARNWASRVKALGLSEPSAASDTPTSLRQQWTFTVLFSCLVRT